MRAISNHRRWAAWLAIGTLVVASTIVRSAASRAVTTPWIAPDEMVYGLLGRSLYASGKLEILNHPAGFLSAVVPAFFGLPLSLGNLELGYSLSKILGAFVMSLAAVPVYLWARSLVPARWALVAATLTLLLPALAYSGLIMSEVLFYPILTCAAWSMAAAVESPTWTRQLGFCAVLVVAVLTRPQAVLLVPAYVGAVAIDSLIGRRRPRARVFMPSLVGIGVAAAGGLLAIVAAHRPVLGGYSGADRHYPIGRALAYVVYHAGDVVLLTGVLPACAVGLLLATALHRGEGDPRVRAYLSAATAIAVASVIEVGVFASGNVGHLSERQLIGLAPVFFVGFVLWLASDAVGSRRARASVAVVALAAVAAIPLGRFVTPFTLVDGFSLIPLYHLRELTSLHVTVLALDGGVALAVALFALVPRRAALGLPVLVGLVLAAGSVAASRQVVSESNAQRVAMVGPVRSWVDQATGGPVAYLYDQSIQFNAVWQTLFWNPTIESVYDFPAMLVAGPLPQKALLIEPDGTLQTPLGLRPRPPFAVAPQPYLLVGKPIAYSPKNADQSGLALWKVALPLRVSEITFGLEDNGDIDPAAGDTVGGATAYDCRHGGFALTLLVKEPETIRIELDGRTVRTGVFPGATTWSLNVPVRDGVGARARTCRLEIRPSGLTGTTQLAFRHL